MPTGFFLTSNGTLVGNTCGSNGSKSINITTTDSTNATVTGNISAIVNSGPSACNTSITSSSVPANGTVNVAYSQTIVATGGSAPYTYTIAGGSLPTGLSLSSGGVISGTPTVAGTYSFSIRFTDSSSQVNTQNFSITINNVSMSLSAGSATGKQVGSSYSQANTVSGGTGPYSYSVFSGSLPAGTTLNTSTGTVSGTPTTTGAFSYVIRVTDSLSATANTSTISGTITAAPTLTANASTGIQVGSAYSQTNTVAGGTSPYTYSVFSGSLPAGTTLNTSTGVVSGTLTTTGSYSYVIRVTDALNATANTSTVSGTIISTPTLTANSATGKQVGASYSQTNVATGGTGSYDYSIISGALPAGLILNNTTGLVYGNPTQAGAFSYTIQVNDGATTTLQVVSGTISAPTITISPSSLPSGKVGNAYSHTISASGGTTPYSYLVSSGSLPAGLSLNSSSGNISGTPTASGTSNFIIQAIDNSTGTSAPFSQTKSYSIVIDNADLVLTSNPSSSAQIQVLYSQSKVATGGTGSYTYSLSSGSLPAGVSLNTTTGLVSGTPTQAGAFSYTIQVSDGVSTTSQSTSVTINAPTITITPSTLPSGTVGTAYNQTISYYSFYLFSDIRIITSRIKFKFFKWCNLWYSSY